MEQKIYLLPGTMCNEMLWCEISKLLEMDFELIHVPIPALKCLDKIVDELFNRLPHEKINLLGCSLGGYLAAYYSIKYPDRVARLFSISNSPCALKHDEISQREALITWVKEKGYQGVPKDKVRGLFDLKNQDSDFIDIMLKMDAALGESCLISQLEGTSYRQDLFSALCKLSIPVWFHFSPEDPMVDAIKLNDFYQNNQNCELIKAPGSGHMLPFERPEELAHAIRKWIYTD